MQMTGETYTCAAGETFDIVARGLWGDEKYAADLLCANPEQATKAFFEGGEILYIPQVYVPAEGEISLPTAAPWRTE